MGAHTTHTYNVVTTPHTHYVACRCGPCGWWASHTPRHAPVLQVWLVGLVAVGSVVYILGMARKEWQKIKDFVQNKVDHTLSITHLDRVVTRKRKGSSSNDGVLVDEDEQASSRQAAALAAIESDIEEHALDNPLHNTGGD